MLRDVVLGLLMAGAAAWGLWFMTQTFVTGLDGQVYYALFDDGMISMRYARMFAAGHGLVWNAGEYVEGYTNPLWTLVMAGCVAVFGVLKAPLAVQVLGWMTWLACGIAAAAVTDVLVAGRAVKRGWKIWAPVLAAVLAWAYYPLAYWSITGMEVGPLTLVALLVAWLVLPRWDGEPSVGVLAGLWVLCSVAYGLRPDGVLVVVLPLAVWWCKAALRRDWVSLAKLSGLAAGVAAVMVGHLLWRHWYYGAWIPNTYLLKMVGDPAWHRLSNGWGFLHQFLTSHGLLLLAAAGLTAWLRRLDMLVLLGVMALGMAYQTWVGGDPWPYWRQLTPGVVLLAPVLAAGAFSQRKVWVTAGLVIVVVMAWWNADLPFKKQMNGRFLPYQVEAARDNVRTAQVLGKVLAPDAVVAVVWGGTLPYYWPGPAYDLLGKTNREIASLPVDLEYPAFNGMKGTVGHNHHDMGYVLTVVRPDYTQEVAWGPKDDHWDLVRAGKYRYMKVNGLELFLREDARLLPGVTVTRGAK
jgi:hypothetical protein